MEIPLTPAFVEYLRSDGIQLTPDELDSERAAELQQDGWDADDESSDPSLAWPEIHQQVKDTIKSFKAVAPKLNWSAPKDATYMTANSLKCISANDVYLLLKSSDFIMHDLEHPFDDCTDGSSKSTKDTKYTLILRKWVNVNPSVEFRCFVRNKRVVGICQRDLNYYEFLAPMSDQLKMEILEFFYVELQDTFPDPNYTFDVYIPNPFNKVWLIDINPWTPTTDPILFSWLELLTMHVPPPLLGIPDSNIPENFVRLRITSAEDDTESSSPDSDVEENMEEIPYNAELRLLKLGDPETRSNASKYSAHKLPRDFVQAGMEGPGPMRQLVDEMKASMEAANRGEVYDPEDDD